MVTMLYDLNHNLFSEVFGVPVDIVIFKGAYDRPEKYIEKNKTRKIKKLYK
jgi:hypothetical protein